MPGNRTANLVFGLVFVILGVVIVVAAWESTPVGAAVAALLVGGLGADAMLSGARGKRSLLSRIGPLP